MALAISLALLISYTMIGYISYIKLPFIYYKKLQFILFNIVLPVFIFLNLFNHLTTEFFINNIYIILGQFWFLGLAVIFLKFSKLKFDKVNFNTLSFQNAAYLPLPVIMVLPGSAQLKVLLFMFVIGFNVTIFSIGAMVFSGQRNLKGVLNLPFIATIVAIVVVLLGFGGVNSNLCFQVEDILGIILIPGVLFFFGGVLHHSTKGKSLKLNTDIAELVFAKYFIFPSLTMILVLALDLNKLIATILIIESLMPPAVNLVLLPSSDDDKDQISLNMFYLYLAFMVGAVLFIAYQLLAS